MYFGHYLMVKLAKYIDHYLMVKLVKSIDFYETDVTYYTSITLNKFILFNSIQK